MTRPRRPPKDASDRDKLDFLVDAIDGVPQLRYRGLLDRVARVELISGATALVVMSYILGTLDPIRIPLLANLTSFILKIFGG